MTALSILLGRALTASVLPVELLVFYQVILPSVLYRAGHNLGRVPRPHKANGLLGTSALGGGGWLPLPLGVGAENLLLRGQAYTHWTRAGVTEPNRTDQGENTPRPSVSQSACVSLPQ